MVAGKVSGHFPGTQRARGARWPGDSAFPMSPFRSALRSERAREDSFGTMVLLKPCDRKESLMALKIAQLAEVLQSVLTDQADEAH